MQQYQALITKKLLQLRQPAQIDPPYLPGGANVTLVIHGSLGLHESPPNGISIGSAVIVGLSLSIVINTQRHWQKHDTKNSLHLATCAVIWAERTEIVNITTLCFMKNTPV